MSHLPQGEIRPNSVHIAHADSMARQLFPLAADTAAIVSLPWFRLVNVLADAMTTARLDDGFRHSTCPRLYAAALAGPAFPQIQDEAERVAMPLSRLIDLVAQAMALTDMPIPPVCLQTDALERGMHHTLVLLRDLQALVLTIGARQPDVGGDQSLCDQWQTTETALAVMTKDVGALWQKCHRVCGLYNALALEWQRTMAVSCAQD